MKYELEIYLPGNPGSDVGDMFGPADTLFSGLAFAGVDHRSGDGFGDVDPRGGRP